MADPPHRPVISCNPGIRPCVVALLLVAALAGPACPSPAQEAPPVGPPLAEEATPAAGLADLGPEAAALRERKARLADRLAILGDLDPLRRELQPVREKLTAQADRLKSLRQSDAYGFDQLAEVRSAVRTSLGAVENVRERGAGRLAEIETAKGEWGEERERWQQREDAAATGDPTRAEARQAADQALGLLEGAQAPIVGFLREVEELRGSAQEVADEANGLLRAIRDDLFRKSQPSLLSPRFYAQFDAGLWRDLRAAAASVDLPSREFFAAQGWVAALQLLLSLGVALGLRRHSRGESGSDRWQFLFRRPFSAGFLVGVSALSPLYGEIPALWRLALWTAVGTGAARLGAGLVQRPWRRRLLYLLAGIFLLSQFFRLMGLPTPLFRTYVALVGLGGSALCWWRATENQRRGGAFLYIAGLRLGAAVLLGVFVAQVGGYSGLASHLLEASIKTTFFLLFAWMLVLLVKGAVELFMGSALVRRSPIVGRHADGFRQRLELALDALVAVLALAALLQVWRFYETVGQALGGLASLGFFVGETRVTLGLGALALALLYGALFASWLFQRVLDEEIYPRRRVEHGVGLSINRLVHYAFVFLGFLVAVSVLGLDLRNFTILAGAFGIGIGFGLQNIVNNFVSGLILLFERPIKVGDMVQLDDEWGRIKKMGLRATVVQTVDHSEVIVPNSDLVSQPLTNWTLSDRRSRLRLPVGIAYGSDVPLAMEILEEVSVEHPLVLEDPEPQALFLEFGDSSLQLELRVWVADLDKRFLVRSELNQAIDRKFREHGVEIPFPQRDLHLRTVDAPARSSLERVVQPRSSSSGGAPAQSP